MRGGMVCVTKEGHMTPTAFMDRDRPPTASEIADALGSAAPLWDRMTRFVETSYGVEPTLVPPSKNYGWDVKYRKGGKTLVSLTPDEGRFTALVVLGQKEAAGASDLELGAHVRSVLAEARPLRDGRWLFVLVESERDVEDIERLLALKRRPRVSTPAG
jgi:hypothetical protein